MRIYASSINRDLRGLNGFSIMHSMLKYEQKKERVKELLQMQEEIENELRLLLEPERVPMLPKNFSMSEQVFSLVQESGIGGVSPSDVLKALQGTYGEAIDREKVASALAYLKNTKKTIEQTTRGLYRVPIKMETEEDLDF